MRAILLVGGEGTRLRPLTFTIPKQMLPIAEEPMIQRVLERLARHGIDDAVLSMGYRPHAFTDAFPYGRCAGVRLTYAVEPEPLDTAGAIAYAARYAGVDQTCLVLNGDVLTDLDYTDLIDRHRSTGADATISLTPVEDPSRFGVVSTDDGGKVSAFIEKPPRDEAPTNLINAGTYVLEPSVIERIPDGRRVSIERETFPQLVADGSLYAFASETYWLDTGTPEKYLQANLDYIDGQHGVPYAEGAIETEPGVHVIGAAHVNGEVRGPCLFGDGVETATGSVVERSVVGSGVTVASGARIVDSVVLPGATIGADAAIEGSIVGQDTRIGEKAQLRDLSVVGGGSEIRAGEQITGERVGA